jgi:dynein heavy chain
MAIRHAYPASDNSGSGVGGDQKTDLASRLYRQGGSDGQAGLPRLVNSAVNRKPLVGAGNEGATQLRKPQRTDGRQVLVPHTNYRPITLPTADATQQASMRSMILPPLEASQSAPGLTGKRPQIGTRNTSVPSGMVGKQNVPDRTRPRSASQGREQASQEVVALEATAGPGEEPKVDPADPSWISPADFVEFILNHQSLTEEFCYMNRSGPYDFEIVPFSKINPNDYMTISIRGVTHYSNGEHDYQDLSEWQRDQEMYRKIVQIPFFDKYQRWKLFSVWKSVMRNQRVHNCSKTLNANLFSLDQTLVDALLKCRTLCVKISTWNLLEINSMTCYQLEEFQEAQMKVRQDKIRELNEVWQKIKDVLLQSCTESLQNFLKKNGFGQTKIQMDEPKEGGADDEEAAAKSYTEQATTRTQCRKLTKFIRTVQYLFNDAIAQMVQYTTQRLLEVLDSFVETNEQSVEAEQHQEHKGGGGQAGGHKGEDKKGQKKPNFMIECVLDTSTGLRFQPKGEKIRESLATCLMDALRAVSGKQTFLQVDDFNCFTQPLAELGDNLSLEEQQQDLYGLVVQDPKYKELQGLISARYNTLFDRVVSFAQRFEEFVQIFNENAELADCSETFAEATLDDFRGALGKYKQQIDDIKNISRSKDVGLFRLDCRRMQETLLPSPTRCNQLLADYIPLLAMQRQAVLAEEIRAANEQLSRYPSNVDEYVEFNVNLQKIDANMSKTEARYTEIQEMGEIIREYGIRIDTDTRKAFSDLASARNQLTLQVNSGKERAESDVTHFSKALEQDIPELHSRVTEQTERLTRPDFGDTSKMNKESRKEVLALLTEIEEQVTKAVDDAGRFNRYQDVLKMEPTPFEDVDELKVDLVTKAKLWRGMDSWEDLSEQWNSTAFGTVDVETINKKVMEYNKIAVQSQKAMTENEVPQIWGAAVSQFKNTLPVVVALRNKALKPRHWEVINGLIEQELDLEDEQFTLGKLLDMKVDRHMEAIQEVSGKATAELALEEMLAKVKNTWEDMELIVNGYKDNKDVFILGSVEDITVALEDSLVTISTIAGSRFVGPIREEVEGWQKDLLLFQETLDEWLNVQRNWMYLESIFGAGDIKKQLPTESAKFMEIDAKWRAVMKETHEYAVALKACCRPGRLELFRNANETLDQIQKQLEDYLLSKCIAFPRFFFLSNDELLEILSQARRPQAVQPHLRKCFDNLVKLRFGDDQRSTDIHAMISGEGEEIPLLKVLKARGNVEKWLSLDGGVEDAMIKTMREVIKKGWKDYPERPRKDWVRDQYCQVMITVGSIFWTSESEEVLTNESGNKVQAMGKWFEKNKKQLEGLTELIRDKLTKNQRKGVVALVTQDVHNRDIIETLYNDKITNLMSFKWQQQLRYYWDLEVDDCVIRQVDATITYGHEYMGALSRLVITPLTDRCWMTITGALHIKLGAAPAGPAGTGKTESTKDLAKGLAKQCVVFNCSDQIDYKMMGKLYSGVVSAGAWTCLDEFNRISIEVLSVVAQQVLEIRVALLEKKTDFVFEGRPLKVKASCGIFITMNPGYAGRTELPDNLKVLFRPVAMMVPDYTLIAEIMLYAEGFGTAKILSGKFTKLYSLSSEQLSKQDHYDFGMRAVKSVLVMAGSLKRGEPEADENILLIRAMRDSNVPKFLSHDLPLFFAIVNDLFPGVDVPYVNYGALQVEIEAAMAKQALQVHDKLVTKTIQLFETFMVRFGVMLVGPSLAGKTTDYKSLAIALSALREDNNPDERFQKTKFTCFNPKSITMGELYGEFNPLTQEWTDGLGSKIMRGFVVEETPDYKWTVFDGPVDAIWIESMNTVLDDNMTLCLANGERVKLNWSMRMLFEVEDLKVASPATVSRCGMVYLTPEDLSWEPFVKTWLKLLPDEPFTKKAKEMIWTSFEHVPKALAWLRKNGVEPVVTLDTQLVISLCRLFQALLNSNCATANSCASKDALGEIPLAPRNFATMEAAEFEKFVIPSFCWAFTWTLGGSANAKTRKAFERLIEDWFPNVSMPRGGGPYDGFINFHEGPKWRPWTELVPQFTYDDTLSYFQLLVPNPDTVRFSYIMDRMITLQSSVFLTGESGVGKSVNVQNLLEKMKDLANVVPFFMTFSAQTKAGNTQLTMEGKLEKKRKTLLGAPVNKTVVFLIDDVNMPMVEEYGAQQAIELLRQFQDLKGFWDRKKHEWKDVENTSILLCAAPPGGGRNLMTTRFTRHSLVVCMPNTSEETMTVIFGSIIHGFLQKFKQEIQGLGNAAVAATIDLYNKCGDELLPTPTRPHYTFNLRDVSKVFQGLLMVKPMHVASAEAFTRLWFHEVCRVFMDRLINAGDKNWFSEATKGQLQSRFRVMDYDPEVWGAVTWCDYLRPVDSRVYEEAKDRAKVLKQLEDSNDEYNLTHTAPMNLVFFRDCVDHISRVSRVFRQPRGNLLLVGVGGSGRSSCARLCACMSETAEMEIALTKGYGIDAFREDVKKVVISAGAGEAKPTMFLMSDTQIINETFLEDINNILNAGEVPNLFPNDEMERIIGDTRARCKDAGRSEAKDSVWTFFIEKCRENLHIVLTMSPVGSALRVRMRMFPALVNCCTIDWFLPWPDEALLGVSNRQLETMQGVSQEQKEAVAWSCCQVHQQVLKTAEVFEERLRRKVYVTPKSYLDLISLYLEMIQEKREEKDVALQRLQTGVNKIDEANGVVNGLQEELTKLAPVIAEKIQEAEELVPIVTEEQKKAEVIKERVSAEEVVVRAQAEEVRGVQEDAQRDLDVAMPALESALKSLDSLDKKDIGEIKGFVKPPPLVMLTMEAVNVLLQEKPDWDQAKKVLTDSKFMDRLKQFDKDNIPPKVLKQLEKYTTNPDYTADKVGNQSKASKSLCMWTHAMDTYSKVAKEVEPKKAKVAQLNKTLNAANAALKEKQDNLRSVEEQVATLKKQLKDTNDEKERLLSEQEVTKGRLKRADILTVGLADEGVRWRQTVVDIRKERDNLTGDVFLSSAAISYYGPFTGIYRLDIVEAWLDFVKKNGLPCGDTFDLREVMGNPVEIRDWNLQGLPTDAVSINNGVLVVRGKRWPLMIDPQAQGNKWIKKKEGKDLKAIKMTNSKMLLLLEGCIRVGTPLLMEDIEETLDPALEPVLLKAVFENGGRLQIKLGDSEVDYDKNFLFYMTTKMPNPHYFPEVCIKVTVINFTVTFDGLEEQLLNEVVSKEIPETLQRRTELMLQLAGDKKVLKQLEDKILKLLSESTGNILDDEVLISTLAESKETSNAVNIRVKAAEVAAVEIDFACKEYTEVATSGSILYFVIADLANINPMYQFSLLYFVRLYNKCIDIADKSTEIDMRLQYLQVSIISNIFLNVCRGLFEDDKLTFSFMISTAFQRHTGEVSMAAWSLLLRGVGLLDMSKKPQNPDQDFFSEKMWEYIYAIQMYCPEHCSDLCEHMVNYTEDWKDWATSDHPYNAPLPMLYDEEGQLHYFHVLLLLKAMRPEKLLFGIQEHVKRAMGENFIIFPSATMQDLYDDSSKSTPIVFVLSTGADPTSMLLRFATQMGYAETLGVISLGQGQGPKAKKMVEEACRKGSWVLLQNCHLYKSFMPDLEKMCENLEESNLIHRDFRLFLTSMPAIYFPVPVLQNGIKLTIEPPKGFRANILRSFMTVTDESLNDSAKSAEWKKIQFGLKFFHAVIQERRKFGPLGWNIRYEFNDSDLEASSTIVHNMLELDGEVPWDTLLFVVGHINYGGRVTDDNDRRCLIAILEKYVTPKILDTDYTFSDSGTYKCPANSDSMTVEDWNNLVKNWPLSEQPEVFGMHDNANISFMSQESENLLSVVLSIQPRESGGGGGKSAEEIVAELAHEQQGRLPAQLTNEGAHPTSFSIVEETGLMISLGTCLTQEYGRFNLLLGQMLTTLGQLQKAIKGTIVMTAELDDMFNSLLNNMVPNIWTKNNIGYPSLKPLSSWFEDLILRVEFFCDWIANGSPNAYWISAFYFPQGFLTSVLQGYSRSNMIPVDQLSFEFTVQEIEDASEIEGAPELGIYVHGLFMDGCAWDYEEMVIAEQEDGVMYVPCPVINFVPWQDKKANPEKYNMPLYKTSVRAGTLSTTGHSTNYVLSIELDLEGDQKPSFWVLKGAALLTMLND